MSNSVRSHRRQPSTLLCPWDSPGKNTGVGCHFLLQFMLLSMPYNTLIEPHGCQHLALLFSSVQSLSHVQLFATPMDCSTPGLPVHHLHSQSLLKLISIESVMSSNHLVLSCPLLLSPSIFPSLRVFSNESALCIRWPKYWTFSFNISPSNEYPGLISFRMDWLDLLAGQGTLKSLLQHHSCKN